MTPPSNPTSPPSAPSEPDHVLHLFEGYGIELEYMLVAASDLAVSPICDLVLRDAAGEITTELDDGPIGWSNELALHVIEVKTAGPVPALHDGVAEEFRAALGRIARIAARHGGQLLPGAMHPTMDPDRETKLWPHDGRPIYATYDRVFGCRGHGWSNLQSCHLNLPFAGPEEFGRLHTAIRAILPLLPALAASSPIADGRVTPHLDHRLAVYRGNQRKVASIIGQVVPEPVQTPDAYQREILAPMYRDIAPLDPEGLLQHEWLNSRGAIARFERNAIEIRLLDVQETPLADIAIARLVSAAVEALVEERWIARPGLAALPTGMLSTLLDRAIVAGDRAIIDEPTYLAALGFQGTRASAGELWTWLLEQALVPRLPAGTALRGALATILDQGPLARRILRATGPTPEPERIAEVYRELAGCLLDGQLFRAAP